MRKQALTVVVFFSLSFILSFLAQAQVTQAWAQNISGSGWKNDRLLGYATDAAGNIYVTGGTPPASGSIEDVMTVKYNSSGVEQWRMRYDGGYGSDYGEAVTVDGSGNVYVAAYSRGASNGDYAIIKYNSSGVQQWVTRYDGPGANVDDPKAIALNSTGYLCVTGVTYSTTTKNDITTIFLDPSTGDVVLQDTYNGAGNSDESVAALAVDGSGDFIVVGTAKSTVFLGSEDIVTISYDPTGNRQWVKLYNGTGNYVDGAIAVAADASNNSYVVGKSSGSASGNTDYITIKYNSIGDTLWTRRFDLAGANDFANAVAVDASGNVFVTGYVTEAGGHTSVITFKYSSTGDSLWARTMGISDSENEQGYGVRVDNAGSVYVAGTATDSGATKIFETKYGTAGDTLWASQYWTTSHYTNTVLGMVVGADGKSVIFGTTYAQGSSDGDYLAVKYDSLGQFQWEAVYSSGDNSGDGATAITVDDSGYVYATGSAFFASGGYDNICTVKIKPTGDTAWVRYYDGGSTDGGRAIAVDAQGNVYVAGETYQTAWKVVTIKYNRDGVQQWAQVYSAGGGGDIPNAMTLDASGNVIVTGKTYAGSYDFLTLKYNSSGSMVGTARKYNPSGSSGNDEAHAVVTDASGNFYVVGQCQLTTGISDYDVGIVKYGGLAGTQQWAYTFSGPGTWADDGIGICRDSAGYLYVTGRIWMAAASVPGLTQSNFDIIVIKMSTAGDTIWTRYYSGPSNRDDYPTAIAYDGHGGIYVAGATYNQSSPYDADMTILRMDTAGTVLWSNTYNRPGSNGNEVASALAVDSAGNAYISGSAWNKWSATYVASVDMTVLRYDRQSGNLDWSAFYNGTANSTDAALDIAVSKSGNVFVAGNATGSMTSSDFSVVAFSQSIPLPVEGAKVTATVSSSNVILHWSTVTEVNNAGWEIEKRVIADFQSPIADWKMVGFVRGSGASTSPKQYQYTDAGVKSGRYAYRLKQLDANGSSRYLGETDVQVGQAPKLFTLAQNYPNPFNPSTTIEFTLPNDGFVSLKVYDMLGREVETLVNGQMQAGTVHQATFDASKLPSGTYFARLQAGGKQQIRKMVLMK